MTVSLRKLYTELRASLFFWPAVYVAVGTALGFATTYVDTRRPEWIEDAWYLIPATVDSARGLLSALAGATITVAGVVFSVTMVALQLAASQLSPRVLRGFRRDRTQQHTMAAVVGTFTFSIVAVANTGAIREAVGDEVRANATVTVAVVLAVISILAIVSFIDRAANSIQATEVIRRITMETRARVGQVFPDERQRDTGPDPDDVKRPDGTYRQVRSLHDGWVQQINDASLLEALPGGATARIDVRAGEFVHEDQPLVTLWLEDDGTDHDELMTNVHRAFAVGRTRTLQQDVDFGLRQLVDIGLRAMSPSVNDPTTAYEVLVNLRAVLRDILIRELPARVISDDKGSTIVRAPDLTHEDYIAHAFDQMRYAVAEWPVASIMLLKQLEHLGRTLVDSDHEERIAYLVEQAELMVGNVEDAAPLPRDLAKVREAANRVLNLRAPSE